MSAPLKKAVDNLTSTGHDIVTAVKTLAQTRPELFTTPGDAIARLLASDDTD